MLQDKFELGVYTYEVIFLNTISLFIAKISFIKISPVIITIYLYTYFYLLFISYMF